MKTIFNTFKTIRLLSNPVLFASLSRELKKQEEDKRMKTMKLNKNNTFFHRHYIVQILN